jgi:type IV secretory pathway TrbD component
MATSSMRGSANGFPIGNIVYQSLQRPKLLRGGEWQLSVINNLLVAGLGTMAVVTWNWRLLLGAAFFAWPVQWLIRMLGRHDPQFWQIYFRTRQRPLIRQAHGQPCDRPVTPPRILPKLRKFVA